jgi:hypothetical protein
MALAIQEQIKVGFHLKEILKMDALQSNLPGSDHIPWHVIDKDSLRGFHSELFHRQLEYPFIRLDQTHLRRDDHIIKGILKVPTLMDDLAQITEGIAEQPGLIGLVQVANVLKQVEVKLIIAEELLQHLPELLPWQV